MRKLDIETLKTDLYKLLITAALGLLSIAAGAYPALKFTEFMTARPLDLQNLPQLLIFLLISSATGILLIGLVIDLIMRYTYDTSNVATIENREDSQTSLEMLEEGEVE